MKEKNELKFLKYVIVSWNIYPNAFVAAFVTLIIIEVLTESLTVDHFSTNDKQNNIIRRTFVLFLDKKNHFLSRLKFGNV